MVMPNSVFSFIAISLFALMISQPSKCFADERSERLERIRQLGQQAGRTQAERDIKKAEEDAENEPFSNTN